MKIRILVVIGCFIALKCACFAQDVIVTKDARKINAKVMEVNVNDIKYKNFDNMEGPTYTLLKSDIASIVYQNGQVEIFQTEVTKTPVPVQAQRQITAQSNQLINTKPPMKSGDPLLYQQYKSGKRMKTSGVMLMCLGPAISIGIGGAISAATNEIVVPYCIIGVGSIGSIVGGIRLVKIGQRKKNSAMSQYYSLQPSITPHFQLNFNPNNIGFAYVF